MKAHRNSLPGSKVMCFVRALVESITVPEPLVKGSVSAKLQMTRSGHSIDAGQFR